jgi:hypothetical protein
MPESADLRIGCGLVPNVEPVQKPGEAPKVVGRPDVGDVAVGADQEQERLPCTVPGVQRRLAGGDDVDPGAERMAGSRVIGPTRRAARCDLAQSATGFRTVSSANPRSACA